MFMLLRKKALLPPREKILPLLPFCCSPEAAARKYADVEKILDIHLNLV